MENETKEQENKKIGYKGFDKNLKCKGVQFTIGDVHELPYKEVVRVCTSDGFHYCNKLKDVFSHYSDNGDNRFCEIEVLGSFSDDGNKSATTSFRILREITSEVKEYRIEERMNLDVVKAIQTKYPTFHVGWSIALWLHGIRLKRWSNGSKSDIDMVSPYFILVEGDEDIEITQLNSKGYANDFDECFLYTNEDGKTVKIDYKIDPKQRYEIIEHRGFKYKVSSLEIIMEAKFRYALNGQWKHKQDCYEICGKNLIPSPVSKDLDLDKLFD